MCFIGGYYYPGHGFDLQIDGLNDNVSADGGTD
jgi:hypothetical protein